MNYMQLLAAGALLAIAHSASAQQPSHRLDPADPSAPVPAVTFISSLPAPATKEAVELPTPDMNWRAANRTVAGEPGHAGHHSTQPAPRQEPKEKTPGSEKKDPHKHH